MAAQCLPTCTPSFHNISQEHTIKIHPCKIPSFQPYGRDNGICSVAVNHEGRRREIPTDKRGGERRFCGTAEDGDILVRDGKLEGVLDILHERGSQVDSITYANLLQECIKAKALAQGRLVHQHMIDTRFQPDVFVTNNLINMYARCGSVDDARQVFDKMPERNVVSWTAMIAGYAKNGYSEEALKLFRQMQRLGVKADQFSFGSVLRACAKLTNLEQGRPIHAMIIQTGFESEIHVGSAIIDMYAKCESAEDAYKMFHKMQGRNDVSWNAMISGYTLNGDNNKALKLFCQMQLACMKCNEYTFASVLSACAALGVLEQGKQVHAHINKTKFRSEVHVENALVTMYVKCGDINDARKVFDNMLLRNMVTWTAMIAGYAQNGYEDEALKLFAKMRHACIKPDQFTFASVLQACAGLEDLGRGKQVHAYVLKTEFALNICVGSALLDMYAKCRMVENACQVFERMPYRNVVTWNAMIAGYTHNDEGNEALKLFRQMHTTSMKPDEFTFASLLSAAAILAATKKGEEAHAFIIKIGFESYVSVGNALVTMYTKCGSIDSACKMFDKMPKQNVVSSNAMIAGYVHNGQGEEGFKLFCQMQRVDLKPDKVTFAVVLSECASLAALLLGRQVHAHIVKTGFESEVTVGNALVTMYGRCGSIENACKVFDRMPILDAVSWTAMITGFAHNGSGKEALQLFEEMKLTNMKPNHITFIGVLSACSHVGLVEEGYYYFHSMSRDHGIMPRAEHYACMVDILGRAGRLYEAEDFINRMPLEPDALVWRTLLGACRIHGNTDLGKRVVECILELDPQDAAAYVLLSNIYAASGRWCDVAKSRKMLKDRGLKKEPGCSWIEINSRVHIFVARDRSHPQTEAIYAKLEELNSEIKDAGYILDTKFVLHDIEK